MNQTVVSSISVNMESVAAVRKTRLSQEEVEAISRAVADPKRFAILKQIAKADTMQCSALAEHDCLSPATVSHHLKELHEAGLTDVERCGRTTRLSLRRDVWNAYVEQLGSM